MNTRALLLLSVVFLAISSSRAVVSQDSVIVLKPAPKHQLELDYIKQILASIHYKKVPLSDSLSGVIFNNYFETLDDNKSYFYSSDIEYFSRYKEQLDDDLENTNLDVPFQIFRVYRDRANARMNYALKQIKRGFDFTKDDSLALKNDDDEWAKNEKELDEKWRKILKSQALTLKLANKTDSAASAVLTKRYKRYKKNINQNNSDDVFQLFMNSYTETLDPHTSYFSPVSSDRFNIEMSKSLEGIGARLIQDLDYTIVYEKVPGGPAYKSKEIFKDDKIIGVAQGEDGEFVDIIGWRLSDVVQLIRGPKGSIVRLQIIREGIPITDPAIVRLERDEINLDDQKATAELIPITEGSEKFNMGVITIPSFYLDVSKANTGTDNYNSVSKDVYKHIEDLKTQGMDGLLIDLRFNGGGSLEEAIKMTGLFIDRGPIVQVKGYKGRVRVHRDNDSGAVYDGPLAVLTNRFSASASEIFSGAVQDYKRGIILGEASFGKGTVQRMISLNQQVPNYPNKLGNLKLTIQMFYRVTGSSTQNIGVDADIHYPSAFSAEEFGERSKANALPWEKIASRDYEVTNRISDELKDRLQQLYLHHLNTDPDLMKLNEDIIKIKENRSKKSVSLNYESRKSEQTNGETKVGNTKEVEGTPTAGFVVSEENKEKLSKDPYLKESLRLLAEIIRFKVG